METRFQVFVSSTYTDLVEERREVMQALLELDCIPAGMEMFPAANEEQWELIKTVISGCDYYVVIVGGRYGSLSDDGLSYTEREYDFAVEQGIPIAGFVHGSPDELPRSKSDTDPKLWTRLLKFREKVQSRMVKFYNDPVSLGSVVSRSMVAQMKRHPRPGWVRGEFAMTPEIREELAELRARLAERERDEAVAASGIFTEPDEALQQGTDVVSLGYRYFSQSLNEARTFEGEEDVEWDAILTVIGPLMLDEAAEPEIRGALGQHVLNAILEDEEVPRLNRPRLLIDDASWARVLVQIRALGYVELGSKKRTVSDRAVYWKLSKSGDAHLVKLLAASRN
jgi:hypothetical protein